MSSMLGMQCRVCGWKWTHPYDAPIECPRCDARRGVQTEWRGSAEGGPVSRRMVWRCCGASAAGAHMPGCAGPGVPHAALPEPKPLPGAAPTPLWRPRPTPGLCIRCLQLPDECSCSRRPPAASPTGGGVPRGAAPCNACRCDRCTSLRMALVCAVLLVLLVLGLAAVVSHGG